MKDTKFTFCNFKNGNNFYFYFRFQREENGCWKIQCWKFHCWKMASSYLSFVRIERFFKTKKREMHLAA